LQVFRRHGAIPEDRVKTLRKNKKAWRGQIYPLVFRYKEVIQETMRQLCKENKTGRKPSILRFNLGYGGVYILCGALTSLICRNYKGIK